MIDLSIIIPVFREKRNINLFLAPLVHEVELSDYNCEIIVVDGDKGTTNNFINETGVIKVESLKGRGIQLNKGATIAKGRVFLFLHADSVISLNHIHDIMKSVRQGFSAGAFELEIDTESQILKIFRHVSSLRYHFFRIPFGDQGIFMTSKLFSELGGFKAIPIMEDLEIMKRIRDMGIRITILPRSLITSSRRWDSEGVIKCTFRNILLRLLYRVGVSAKILSELYR